MTHDCEFLASKKRLKCNLDIPDTANTITIEADLRTRSIFISMRLAAPGDKKSSEARITWLLRQLGKTQSDEVRIRAIWPGKAPATQATLAEIREEKSALTKGCDRKMALTSFDVLFVRELSGKFSGPKTFIERLEEAVPDFYEHVGQHLRAWTAPAPKLSGKTEPADVSTAAIQLELEREAAVSEDVQEGDVGKHVDDDELDAVPS